MTSLAALAELPDVSYYNDWDSVKQALQNWSIRDKFTFRTPCKDDRRARYVCTQPGCRFRVTGNKDKGGRITVKVVNREHTCGKNTTDANAASEASNGFDGLQDGQATEQDGANEAEGGNNQKDHKYRNPATQMKWLVTAIQRVLEITTETKPADIQTAAKEYYNEQISYQQAFRCLRLLTVDIKEQGHRERVPDELRKAIVALRVFVDPPMDWIDIERKTGIKARTAGYIFTSAEKKSGGSKDPFVLLKNATISPSGPKAGEKFRKPSSLGKANGTTYSEDAESTHDQSQPRKRRKRDEMIDPNLDVTVELARAAAEIEDVEDESDDLAQEAQPDVYAVQPSPYGRAPIMPIPRRNATSFYTHGNPVDERILIEERVLSALAGHR